MVLAKILTVIPVQMCSLTYWIAIKQDTWIEANIAAVTCDYSLLEAIFDRCICEPLTDE